jgi:dihydrofolate synthase/folylpolyglutamate synthase
LDHAEALAYLSACINYERASQRLAAPTLDRMRRLVHALGDPHLAMPVIHITGTNGKGSTSTILTRLLMEQGLSVGTYTSPHLERINERMRRDLEPIDDDDLAAVVGGVADLALVAGVEPTFFEVVTAAAFRWFAEIAVDVAVVEVGMLGRWDATNVVEPTVSVITNIGLDHTEFAGPTRADIAREKAGIIKAGATVVVGETDPELVGLFRAEAAAVGAAEVLVRDLDFALSDNTLALGGRLLGLRTPLAQTRDVFCSLHGRHQGSNALVALVAAEAFFGAPLADDVVEAALADVGVPGRCEVLGHQPLVILDGAHNPHGAEVFAEVLDTDFQPAGERIYVVGLLRGADRDPETMLRTLGVEDARRVVCCAADSPRAVPVDDLVAACRALGVDAEGAPSVTAACDRALRLAGEDDLVAVTGSLYVIGEARPYLRRRLGTTRR